MPDDLYYDPKDHLWSRVESGLVRVGLDQFGQKASGTVAYIKLLPAGKPVLKGRAFGSLEAGKYIGLQDRIQGAEAIQTWLEAEYREYAEKGLFAEDQ